MYVRKVRTLFVNFVRIILYWISISSKKSVFWRSVYRRFAIWKIRKVCGKNCLTVKSIVWFSIIFYVRRK